MQIKTSAEKLLGAAFVGKKFIRSEFCGEPDDPVYDINSEDTVTTIKELSGKTIRDIEIFAHGYRDAGIGLKFDEYDEYLFFYGNDTLIVED